MAAQDSRSYLSAGLGSLSPWGSRTASPKPPASGGTAGDGGIGKQQGGDHSIDWRHRLSPSRYPGDCPPLNIRWFYAVDVPKRKPLSLAPPPKEGAPPPKKFVPFSLRDSRAIETSFQKCADEEEARNYGREPSDEDSSDISRANKPETHTTTINDARDVDQGGVVKVPVNEDYLFDVDIEKRELAPVYWLGPVYEVRRGTWFYQEGSTLRTCDENLATQLEEGYLKVKPFRYPTPAARSTSQTRQRPSSLRAGDDAKMSAALKAKITTRSSAENLKAQEEQDAREIKAGTSKPRDLPQAPIQAEPLTHRLFGAHLNSVVTYQDATTAWIVTDDFLSRMSSNVYQRIAGGGYLMGTRVVRGYSEPGKAKDKEKDKDGEKKADSTANSTRGDESPREKSLREGSEAEETDIVPEPVVKEPESEFRRMALERKLSNLASSTQAEDSTKQEEEARKRDEKEISNDYRDEDSEEQDREIEHVILVTHGIGQRLGLRMESVNFIHDVNVLRKTLKAVYGTSADLQALNSEVDKLPKNCRVQVLPVCWRHLLDFPKQSVRQNRKEHDLGDLDSFNEELDIYPSLADITVEGVPAVRNLITDLALDILLYQSSYRDHIAGIVLRECNRIYALFKERNPTFHGKVSLLGHSLGSAILFDILCDQKPARPGASQKRDPDQDLDFEVDNFFCIGSPIGLFQMLKGRTIAGRGPADTVPTSRGRAPTSKDDPFLGASNSASDASRMKKGAATANDVGMPFTVSSPKCGQLFNIFHPTDPISYRIEPLISPAMAPLKAQPLPYTKKGIFGAPMGQGLTGISARVGQSVSGLWSSLSSGIASQILNRSLGITGEEGKHLLSSTATSQRDASAVPGQPLSVGAGTNIAGGGVIALPSASDASMGGEESKKRKLATETLAADEAGQHPPTLIDSEIETLYAGFEKRRKSHQSDEGRDMGTSIEWQEAEERGRRLRREEAKVRALNSNGRVDFSIQEGVFDISLIASIASHLSYWADEDVSHFMISQLLSRHRVLQRTRGGAGRRSRPSSGSGQG